MHHVCGSEAQLQLPVSSGQEALYQASGAGDHMFLDRMDAPMDHLEEHHQQPAHHHRQPPAYVAENGCMLVFVRAYSDVWRSVIVA